MALDKDGLFAKIEHDKQNKKIISVHVDDWNEDVFLRRLSSGERSVIESIYFCKNAKPKTTKYFRAHMVCACLCDTHGMQMLQCNKEHFDKLYEAGSRAIDQILDSVLELNGMRPEDVKEAEENFLMNED